MTPYKKNIHQIPASTPWRQRARRGTLYLAVAALLQLHTGCSDSSNGDWEEVTVQEPTKGIVTTIEETASGEFSIVDEQVVPHRDSSRIILKMLNGTTRQLSPKEAQAMIEPRDTVSNTQHAQYRPHGLGHVMWWSAMGYMMGRNLSTPVNPAIYRDDRRYGSSSSYGGGYAYRAGSMAASELQRTSTSRTEMRPVSGRSGFFGRSSRGRSFGG
ncbi:MAG TPA: hypothetical protein PK971_16455 [Saprospiraceae bacterium]|nr:hypothetical protein [Saprospiraceae bacterium]HNG88557.1 hypothetical protein [Saprospiraceae bacterium]